MGAARYRTVSTYLFDTCTHRCGYCWIAETGRVLDARQLAPFRDPAYVDTLTSFFNRRTTDMEKWTFHLTGGEPLLMPNLARFCEQLFAHGNRVAFYTALNHIGRRHPSYRLLLEHGQPEVDYVMASFHPESEADEDAYFARVAELKAAGHAIFVRYVGHPARLGNLDRLAARCRDLDVCWYPTTLFSPTHPAAYRDEERLALARHFSGYSQRLQIEGGVYVKGELCTSGSANVCLRLPSGDITPCISVGGPVLGNVFAGRLELLTGPAPCPDPEMRCACDIHFQQDIVLSAPDSERFARQKRGWVEPIPLAAQDAWLRDRGVSCGGAPIAIGQVREDDILVFPRGQVRAAYEALPK